MTTAAAALLKLTADPHYLGARPGLLAVLHTWTRALLYHPHVHVLVTAGGLHRQEPRWVAPKHPEFLVPGWALSRLFRGKFRAALRKTDFFAQVPPEVWRKDWVVHLQPAGTGDKVLDYLARYVFRIALVNSRLERFADGQVTFRYRDTRTHTIKQCTLDAVTFLGRFLQHVLPRGFTKVRHYGLFSPSRHDLLAQARDDLTAASAPRRPTDEARPTDHAIAPAPLAVAAIDRRRRCPVCGLGTLHLVETLPPCGRSP